MLSTHIPDFSKATCKKAKNTIHRPVDSNPGSVLVVPASQAEGNAASFQGPSDVSDHHHVQSMKQAKLLRAPIVDSDIEQQLVFPKRSSSSSSSGSSSSSSSSSDDGSSSSHENDASEDDDVHVTGLYSTCRGVTFLIIIS